MVRKKTVRKKSARVKTEGWNTTDEQEIERRKKRAESESFRITPVDAGNGVFSDWRVAGDSGVPYRVEIRSLDEPVNSCDCKDFQYNRLGVCKHVEAVANRLRKRGGKQARAGSPFVEIYLDGRDHRVKVAFPSTLGKTAKIRQVVSSVFDEAGELRGDPLQSMAALKARLARESPRVRRQARVSSHLEAWLRQRRLSADQREARRRFERDLKNGRASLDVVKLPLYPYQQEGMMHLAFTGRALLADEMGLGKTVQAIAGAELLDRLHALQKVLVISPASLKTEWREQIHKFSHREAVIIQGLRKKRYQLYRQPAFFYLANYEQILYDKDFINETLKPDLIILDEAQRIKNWQTKTAAAIKQLESPYAFVLTGTPLENRIDEIYSIAQFLDPGIFGPLFRFNRDFHQLDERGVAVGYKNLDQLHERLRPIMLRRRKEDVEGELPERSINNYFVPMTDEQAFLYEEYERTVAQLGAIARKRPLKKEERDLLMLSLSCMRMSCDTGYILDQSNRLAPKLDELERLLDELLEDPECKIIVFSEWERMLTLLAERLKKAGIGYAWHTGGVTQKRRREEINRFKRDPACNLFLATDSAATGLNLQVARVVVNLDLPWNPAKLEQRIARAWRKHQKHPVRVINLVSENTLEHRMLEVLRHKTDLADAVVDGAGNIRAMSISTGRGAFMERLDDLLGEAKPPKPPVQRVAESLPPEHDDNLERLEQRGDTLLAVVETPDEKLAKDLKQRVQDNYPQETPPALEMLDRATYDALQRLIKAGVIQFTQPVKGQVGKAQNAEDRAERERRRRQNKIRARVGVAEEKQRMSQLLADGGFIKEALAPLSDALNSLLAAVAIQMDQKIADPATISQVGALQAAARLPTETLSVVAVLRHERDSLDETGAIEALEKSRGVLKAVQSALSARQ